LELHNNNMAWAILACAGLLGGLNNPIAGSQAAALKPFEAPKGFDARADVYMSAWAKEKRFSGTVLMAVDGKPIFRHAYGFSDWSTHQVMTPETPCLLFELSETITAGAIVLLQQRNLLKATDKASLYLPNLPGAWQDVTIHQLLTHTSGIDPVTGDAWMKAQGDATEEAKANNAIAPRVVGDAFARSSVSYYLLGRIIDKVSGKPYERFLQDEIFKPLGMTTAGVGGFMDAQFVVARGHTLSGTQFVPSDQRVDSLGAAGDLHASVDDLLKWSQALETPGLFTAQSIELIHSGYVQMGKSRLFCYGWQRDPARGFWEQTGGGPSFLSEIAKIPRQKLVVIVLRNLAPAMSYLPTEDLIRIVEGGAVSPPRFADFATLNACAGTYQNAKEPPVIVSTTNGDLTVTFPGGKTEVAKAMPDGTFKASDFSAAIAASSPKNYVLKLHLKGSAKVLKRVDSAPTVSARPDRLRTARRKD